jgi:hypothetical protein
MSKTAITVISITEGGRQLTASFNRWNETRLHLRERLRWPVHDAFVQFIVVHTKADEFSTTTAHHLTPRAAARFLAVQDAAKDRYRNRAGGSS